MLTWLREIWLDKAVARTALLVLLAMGGAYSVQPTGRSVFERLMTSAALALGVGGASLSAPKNGGGK